MNPFNAPPPIRACHVCVHSQSFIGRTTIRGVIMETETIHNCAHPEVTRGKGPQRCFEVRAPSGQCGPEARLQHIKGE